MRIVELKIENYRNLDGVSIKFDEDVNYIVGENNLGKSNVLDLLNTIFNQAMLSEEDFADVGKRSGAVVTLKMDEDELGTTGLDVDPMTGDTITVRAFADDPDSRIEFELEGSGEKIPPSLMRSVHMFRYSTASFNRGDLAFDGTRGVGKVLTKGIALYLEKEGKGVSDFLDEEELEGLATELNAIVDDVPILSSYGVKTGVDASDGGSLGSLVTLLDKRGVHFKKAGVGLQYLAIASLSIVESIMRLSPTRLSESLCLGANGKLVLHAVLAYDEPEAHLHPYMQRRLSKSLHRICEGKDNKFNALLKAYFGIDSIRAQLIMVTHSPTFWLAATRTSCDLDRAKVPRRSSAERRSPCPERRKSTSCWALIRYGRPFSPGLSWPLKGRRSPAPFRSSRAALGWIWTIVELWQSGPEGKKTWDRSASF